jgi:DNA polymerase I
MVAPWVLVDGSSYLFRAFHAMPPLTNRQGQPTGAIKGVLNMIGRLQKDYADSNIILVFDAKGKTFRDDIYPAYKANRPPMPEELRSQIEPLHQLIQALGLPLLCVEGVEADDVIGTLAHRLAAEGRPVVISTGDKDMAQLVTDQITLVNTMTDTRLDPAGVVEKFGVGPELIIDFLALMGDKVDNIPGVPGVGEKTALGLLQQLGGLDSLYSRLDEVAALSLRGAKSLADKLRQHEMDARLSYQLATIRCDLSLPGTHELLQATPLDRERLTALLQSLEIRHELSLPVQPASAPPTDLFSAQTEVVQGAAPPVEPLASESPQATYVTLLDQAAFNHWLEKLRAAPVFAFDTETTGLDYMAVSLVGLSFAVAPGEAAYVPLGHDYLGAPEQLDRDWVLAQLKPLLEDPKTPLIGQNIKFDAHILARYGIQFRAYGFDTLIESYVLNSLARHDMDSMALEHLQYRTTTFVDIAGKGSQQLTFNQIDIETATHYAAEDADITLRLHRVLYPQLQQHPRLLEVFNQLDMPLIALLQKIEQQGALLDCARLREQSLFLEQRLQSLEAEAHALAGEPFNLASPKQLGEILFQKLQIPVTKKTAKGAASTAEDVLHELADDYPLPALLLEHRSLAKLKSTYTDKLPTMVTPRTGRVHCSYHQAVTATGRLSSSQPNLQNIPIKTEEGRRIRQAFIAPPGYVLVAADYSQIELRIMAHLSQDASLIQAFLAGEDIHRATAAEVLGLAPAAVTTEQRRRAKAINFGLIYGMSAFGLAKQLQLSRQEAQQYMDIYFERYPGVKRYMDETGLAAQEAGYVETLLGRRLYLPDIRDRNAQRRAGALRTAINAPMQGSAADIMKLAMIAVDHWLTQTALDARIILQVHDELVFEVAETALTPFLAKVKHPMESAYQLSVPLVVDVGHGRNWDEAH